VAAGSLEQPSASGAPTGEVRGTPSERASANSGTINASGNDVPIGLGVGQRPPSFAVNLPDGQQLTDTDLRGQGKPYILYFFATW
jgi:hypothetical protein